MIFTIYFHEGKICDNLRLYGNLAIILYLAFTTKANLYSIFFTVVTYCIMVTYCNTFRDNKLSNSQSVESNHLYSCNNYADLLVHFAIRKV